MKILDNDKEYFHTQVRGAFKTDAILPDRKYITKVWAIHEDEYKKGPWISTVWIPNFYDDQPIKCVANNVVEFRTRVERPHHSSCQLFDTAMQGDQKMHFIHRTIEKTFYYIGELESYETVFKGNRGEPSIFRVTLKNDISQVVQDMMYKSLQAFNPYRIVVKMEQRPLKPFK